MTDAELAAHLAEVTGQLLVTVRTSGIPRSGAAGGQAVVSLSGPCFQYLKLRNLYCSDGFLIEAKAT